MLPSNPPFFLQHPSVNFIKMPAHCILIALQKSTGGQENFGQGSYTFVKPTDGLKHDSKNLNPRHLRLLVSYLSVLLMFPQ